MITFQVITQFNIIETYTKANNLASYFKSTPKRIGICSYLITSDHYKSYIKITKYGFDITLYENNDVFMNKISDFIEKTFTNKHIGIHSNNYKTIKMLTNNKFINIDII